MTAQPNTTAKLATGTIATGVATIVPWLLSLFGIVMPAEVAIAVGGLVALLAAHFTPVGKPNDEVS